VSPLKLVDFIVSWSLFLPADPRPPKRFLDWFREFLLLDAPDLVVFVVVGSVSPLITEFPEPLLFALVLDPYYVVGAAPGLYLIIGQNINPRVRNTGHRAKSSGILVPLHVLRPVMWFRYVCFNVDAVADKYAVCVSGR
jgi:hypothetical protein